jgi:hypothetical protein
MIARLYQDLKPMILDVLLVSKDAIHIHVGFLAFVFAFTIAPKKRRALYLIGIPFTLSLVMELLDFCSDMSEGRSFVFSHHLHDLLNTNFIPVVLTLILTKKYSQEISKA